uniref:Putative secreted peptide n=1 Tax=Anopheles braziliensis TaxID=58242 RepID=A0A2M3ZPW8_9DIPT
MVLLLLLVVLLVIREQPNTGQTVNQGTTAWFLYLFAHHKVCTMSINFLALFDDVRIAQETARFLRHMHLVRFSTGFHSIRQRYIVAPDVKLDALGTDDPAQYRTGVHTDPHLDALVTLRIENAYRLDHTEAHLDAADGMIGPRFRAPRHAVITIAERRNLLAPIHQTQIVETLEQIVQYLHQLFGRLGRGHARKADDVGKQDAHVLHPVHVERPEQ